MRKTDWRRLLCAVLGVIFLCSCAAPVESPRDNVEEKASKAGPKTEVEKIEVQWIETPAETLTGDPELNGRLRDGPLPEGFDVRNRVFIDGGGACYLIGLDGDLVRWGRNWDNMDAGWEEEDGIQPFRLRNVLVKDAVKITIGYLAKFALDRHGTLWG